MELSERQKEILSGIVTEYIKSAEPVSSRLLEKKYRLKVSPATIRNEMQKLIEEGFIFQPHTSAGRVPTDKGYRFFVDSLLERELADFKLGNWFDKEISDSIKFIQSLTKNLAIASQVLVLSYFEEEKIFWKEGWEEILKEPEFREEDCIINFTNLLENFEKGIEDLEVNSRVKVYIGRENRFPKAKDFSIISVRCHLPEEEGIISLLGPKRMAYERNISLMNSLIKVLEIPNYVRRKR